MFAVLVLGLLLRPQFAAGSMRRRMLADVFAPLEHTSVESLALSSVRINRCYAVTASFLEQEVTGYGYTMTRACEDACARIFVSKFITPSGADRT